MVCLYRFCMVRLTAGLVVALHLVLTSCPKATAQEQLLVDADNDETRRPNVLLVFCDDIGFGDLGSYGHPYAETPNLDRLAKEGTMFTQFHVSGNVCPVTRAGLMTSRNPSWFPNYSRDYGFMGQPTIMNVLQDSGYYTTAHIGKWNIGPDPAKDAIEYGIDYHSESGSISGDPRGKEGERFDDTISFLEQQADATLPFYLNLWLYTTHTPIRPPDAFVEHFQNVSVNRSDFGYHMQTKFDTVEGFGGNLDEDMRTYLAEVLALDVQVGRLLDKLDELALADNTVVVFSSDNGPERAKRGRTEAIGYAGGLRGEKHSFYEGGTRVPLLVRWPGRVPAGRVDNGSIMSGLDWFPTVASLARVPNIPWSQVEGENMEDVWRGASRSRTQPLFFREWKTRSHGYVYVRYGRWKLHRKEEELYDIATDPEERVNLYRSANHTNVLFALSEVIDDWVLTLPTNHSRLPDQKKALPFDPAAPVVYPPLPKLAGAFETFAPPALTFSSLSSTGTPTVPSSPTVSPVTSPSTTPTITTGTPIMIITTRPVTTPRTWSPGTWSPFATFVQVSPDNGGAPTTAAPASSSPTPTSVSPSTPPHSVSPTLATQPPNDESGATVFDDRAISSSQTDSSQRNTYGQIALAVWALIG